MSRTETDGTPERFDVLRYADGANRAVPAGDGQQVVAAHVSASRKQQLLASGATGLIAVVAVVLGGLWVYDSAVLALGVGLGLGVVAAVLRAQYWSHDDAVPELVVSDAAERVARDYVDDFDPDEVSDPFA